MFTDTHAHLDFPEFEGRLDEILARAREAGVHRVITIGIDRESCRRSLAIAEKFDNVFAAVGLHPCSVMEPGARDFLAELPALARHPKVVAIGEAGMDYHHFPEGASGTAGNAVKSAQAEAFKIQLDTAAELGLNVIIHQRDAWQDTLEVLRPFTGALRGVFHCFGGTPEAVAEVAAMGHLVSFTGIVTFKNAAQAQAAVKSAGPGGYMVETDCPYLAPVPFRGKTCEPAHVRLVAEKIAGLRGEPLEKIAADTEGVVREFFKL